MIHRLMGEMLLGSTHLAGMMSYLVEAVSEHDRTLLDELERAIEEKRRELHEKEDR